jgi:hypothetical protein
MLQVLPIANQARDRPHFTAGNGVLTTACALVTVIYVSVGFFAYVSTRDFESTQHNLAIHPWSTDNTETTNWGSGLRCLSETGAW